MDAVSRFEWLKYATGPVLALLPILAWEFFLKPARVRRNVALGLLAEIDQNLVWLMRLVAKRTTDKTGLNATPRARTLVFSAHATALAELPPEILSDLLSFYSGIEDIVAAMVKLHQLDAARDGANEERKKHIVETMRRGHVSMDNNLPAVIRRGEALRQTLHDCARDFPYADVPPLAAFRTLRDQAVESDVARRVAEGERAS